MNMEEETSIGDKENEDVNNIDNVWDSKKNELKKRGRTVLNVLEGSNAVRKFEIWGKLLSQKRHNSSVKLNMYMTSQKQFLKYNKNKRGSIPDRGIISVE